MSFTKSGVILETVWCCTALRNLIAVFLSILSGAGVVVSFRREQRKPLFCRLFRSLLVLYATEGKLNPTESQKPLLKDFSDVYLESKRHKVNINCMIRN